ncbi:MAG TPA: hypothetical protein VGL61_02965 [Kofleriaceae bacterium]|jgi:cell division protein FtsL
MNKLVLAAIVMFSLGAHADPPPAPAPTTANAALEQQCRDALNADQAFEKAIANKIGIQLDEETVKVHEAADAQVKMNERHVIYAYAAMWAVAALFLIYLLFRQQALKSEIAALRRDLEAAAK